ncbi:uracil-DNA glycosylase [Candidatus Kaiserbacteria bacterium CG10_big_fil_rev_8_21_14_0_10_43_70]|uniref:Type-4 uracil-DNA glycosylase n=1 Tax=Candidatus Kaiserbacteria bacterium CG10_big_fil_rev_8_21_14_0_10_43_70 TaxID=1974605 RepID=A0A2H0UIM9_9BACT|nr:MAG: uracil-DNA glycosylase [Candidatus Kaiserbacteria bacterium CG10_big_fil_rev_8_21_14_0_10_43_70]
MNKTEEMRKVRDGVVALTGELAEYRIQEGNHAVLGEGYHDASIMFVGEAPGRNEAKTGRPFCGAAGKILDELLASIGVERESVYITNIVKDRPPNNRDPSPGEIETYAPFLDRQIEIIQPKIIATLGRFAMDYIMRKFDLSFEIEPISTAHGKKYEAETNYGKVMIVPLYHPAAAIYNQSLKETLREDFKILKN